ncbi:hypothetical protein EEAAV_26910 (plasmid) [Rahnella aceris]
MKILSRLRNEVYGKTTRLLLDVPPNRPYWISMAILGLPTAIGLPYLTDLALGSISIPISLPVIASVDAGVNLVASVALVTSLYRWQIKPSVRGLTQWAKLAGLTLIANTSLLASIPIVNRWFPEMIGTPLSVLVASASAGAAWLIGKRVLAQPDANYSIPDEAERPHRGYRLALRETGQLLMLCALRTAPCQATAVITQRRCMGIDLGVHGYVDFRHYCEEFTAATAARDMMVYLAGMSAERTMLGTVGQGGQSDMANFVTTAKRYLSNGFRFPYFPHPICDAESRHNAIVLSELLNTFQQCCDAFMERNSQLLVELAHVLNKRGELSLADLLPLNASIVYPDEFHQIVGSSTYNIGKTILPKGEAA